MRNQSFLATSLCFVLAGCGSDTGESTASASGNGEEAAAMMQAALPAGGGAEPLVISQRTYTSGSANVKVSGFFTVDGTQQLNQSGLTDDDQTWIPYGTSGGQELNVLFTNSAAMAEHGVTIGLGPYIVTAVSTSGECRTKIDVTPTLVTGRYSCTGTTARNNQTGQMGEVDIEVEFSAGS
ncbi:MAG: hypothetical protein ACT4UQ_01675 [Gammaproteobacteria bacterium]